MNWPVAIGAVLVFVGYLLVMLGDVLFLGLPEAPSSGQFLAVYSVFIAGEAVLGIGFLLAFLGLALRR